MVGPSIAESIRSKSLDFSPNVNHARSWLYDLRKVKERFKVRSLDQAIAGSADTPGFSLKWKVGVWNMSSIVEHAVKDDGSVEKPLWKTGDCNRETLVCEVEYEKLECKRELREGLLLILKDVQQVWK